MEQSCQRPATAASYVSCIKLHGYPIIGPFMDAAKRVEMQRYRQHAVAVERELREKRAQGVSCDSGVSDTLGCSGSDLSDSHHSLSLHSSTNTDNSSARLSSLANSSSYQEYVNPIFVPPQTFHSFPPLDDLKACLENTIESQLSFDKNAETLDAEDSDVASGQEAIRIVKSTITDQDLAIDLNAIRCEALSPSQDKHRNTGIKNNDSSINKDSETGLLMERSSMTLQDSDTAISVEYASTAAKETLQDKDSDAGISAEYASTAAKDKDSDAGISSMTMKDKAMYNVSKVETPSTSLKDKTNDGSEVLFVATKDDSFNTTGSTDLNQYLDLTMSSVGSPPRDAIRQQDFSLTPYDPQLNVRVPGETGRLEKEAFGFVQFPLLSCSSPPLCLPSLDTCLTSPDIHLTRPSIFASDNKQTTSFTSEPKVDSQSMKLQDINATQQALRERNQWQQTSSHKPSEVGSSFHFKSVTRGVNNNSAYDNVAASTECSVNDGHKRDATQLVDALDLPAVPSLVRQNSYTLLDGPSPLILAHLSSRGSNNVSPSGSNSSARKGWDLQHAKQFWSSTDTIHQLFAVPRVPNRKTPQCRTAPAKTYRNTSLPSSAGPSPTKKPHFSESLERLTSPKKQATRRSLFGVDKNATAVSPRRASFSGAVSRKNHTADCSRKTVPSKSGSGRTKDVESPKKAPGSLNFATESNKQPRDSPGLEASARKQGDVAQRLEQGNEEEPEAGKAVSNIRDIIRLQREHLERELNKQMALLMEKQRADQEKMRREFRLQEEKLLADLQQHFPASPGVNSAAPSQLLTLSQADLEAKSSRASVYSSASDIPHRDTGSDCYLVRSVSDIPHRETSSEIHLVRSASDMSQQTEQISASMRGSYTPDANRQVKPSQSNSQHIATVKPSAGETQRSPRPHNNPSHDFTSQRNSLNSRRSYDTMSAHKENMADKNAKLETMSAHKENMADKNAKLETMSAHKENMADKNAKLETMSAHKENMADKNAKLETMSAHKENMADKNDVKSPSRCSDMLRPLHENNRISLTGRDTDVTSLGQDTTDDDSSCTLSLASEHLLSSDSTWRARFSANSRSKPVAHRHSYTPQEKAAAAKIVAAARGFLVRRLMRTNHVQDIVRTIKDVTVAAMELHQEVSDLIREEDVDLSRRLIQQLNASWYAFSDVFFSMSTAERMSLISADRARSSSRRSDVGRSVRRISLASQRSLKRKLDSMNGCHRTSTSSMSRSLPSSRPSSSVRLSSASSVSSSARHSALSASIDCPRALPQHSSRKPWR